MSITKTELIVHTVPVQTTTTVLNPTRRFLLPAGESDDMGLVMRLDSKKMDRPLGSTPVPAKLCGQTKAVARWALFTWTGQVNKVNESTQRLLMRLLPVMLYTSLLVSAIQACGVIYLLAASVLPIGAWFLLGCLATMCYFYVSTSQTFVSTLSRRPSHSSSTNISPSSSASQNLGSSSS